MRKGQTKADCMVPFGSLAAEGRVKGVSRQRMWQLAKRTIGHCRQCGKDAEGKELCALCKAKRTEREGL
jgi:recombinational DNA repair protein RecR